MRLSELLDTPVHDSTGELVGNVHDVVLSHRMLPVPSTDGARLLRIEHLVLRRSSFGGRLGYGLRSMKGPTPIAQVLHRIAEQAPIAAWDDIESYEDGRIVLRCTKAELRTLRDIEGLP